MTQAGGFDVQLLGIITIPKFIETNIEMYPTFVQFHYQSMIALIVVFGTFKRRAVSPINQFR